MRKVYLKDTTDVRRALARVFFDLESGAITQTQAHKLAYILNVMLKATSLEWQERQVMPLWDRVNELEGSDE